ncbi:hypothetical protein F5Y10DRAFT_251358 [Nemania abortiva]|nr:hypothetical protein F5Y10DRAFT_251358 [Nemania abortiva]
MQSLIQVEEDGDHREVVDNTRGDDNTQCTPTHSNESETCLPNYTYSNANPLACKRASKLSSSASSPSSSGMCFHNLDAANTDPEHMTQLWKAVMSHHNNIERSGWRRVNPSESLSEPTTPSLPLASRTTSFDTRSSRPGRGTNARVTDADFMESVLEPYGIEIRYKGANKDLRKHFGILGLHRDLKERLDIYKKAFAAPLSVWLEIDQERIQRIQQEYESLRVYGCNEAEYSAYALRDIFLSEPRYPRLPAQEGEQCWLPIRMLQLAQKPGKLQLENWDAPPELRRPSRRYEWDVHPNCAYYVSLRAFDARVRSSIGDYVSVVQRRAFCSYFTIEFKQDEEDITTTRYRVAVASAMALYNRYCLKISALQKSGRDWDEKQKGQMRHYGITCTGLRWNLWCTVPKSFENWTGCSMLKLCSGDCDVYEGTQKLMGIVNDTHYWGLEVHGKSCKGDIVAIARSDPDADLNHITLLAG